MSFLPQTPNRQSVSKKGRAEGIARWRKLKKLRIIMDKNTIKQRVRAKFNGMKFRGTSDMTCSAIDEVIDNLEGGGLM